jgi:hypothetical protein
VGQFGKRFCLEIEKCSLSTSVKEWLLGKITDAVEKFPYATAYTKTVRIGDIKQNVYGKI